MRLICLAMITVFAAACGGSSDSSAAFVGTWMPAPGSMLTGTCSDGSTISSMLTTPNVYAKGVDADLTTTSGGCTVKYSVSGSKASANSGQSCTTMNGGSRR